MQVGRPMRFDMTPVGLSYNLWGMGIADRIKQARVHAQLTQAELAERIGVKQPTIAGWERGDHAPRWHRIKRLAEVLEVEPAWLAEEGMQPSFRRLKIGVRDAEVVASSPNMARAQPATVRAAREIPVISYVDAGRGKEAVDAYMLGDGMETVWLDERLIQEIGIGPHAFGLRIAGDSMAPAFTESDLVIIDPDAQVRPGDIVVAKVNGDEEATIKVFKDRGTDRYGNPLFDLVPMNDNYPTIQCSAQNPGHIIGPVVEHRRRLKRG